MEKTAKSDNLTEGIRQDRISYKDVYNYDFLGFPTVVFLCQEIECPRCNNIMTLKSDFDTLGYVCQECDLLLVMKYT